MILRQAARLGIAGAATGLCVATAVGPLVVGTFASSELGVGRDAWMDPAVTAATTGFLVAVVLTAAWLPARRAARIEPTLALKRP
jgi:ABC-type lipoprotein release transport system permease subunit